ncbi:hypothetical protein N1028_08000 [Herbiconiux sp. CPCC 203407]|uniref:Uncharacterized protein n=1 Tax=Herbiconiux oxytropis TaxID=2970915 RepID=A0AA42BUY0_9MICO|nr:hypothetical protein [Herbiconiux oxytropis]MCS5722901.1 hypothetical protein [Herbiconiux oxytropis]MCS5725839.1 hypothetical protein [Herbiconiux oxytropis]
MQAGPRHLTPDEFWNRVDETDERLRASFEPAGAFGLVEWPGFAMVTDWDYSGHTRVLSFAHELPPKDSPEERDPDRAPPVGTGRGEDAFEVHVHWREGDSRSVVERLRRRAERVDGGSQYRVLSPAEGLPDSIVPLALGGLEHPFELWERGDRWWAATTVGGRTLAVEARGVSPDAIALDRVTDVEPFLQGRRAWLRRVRSDS